MRARLLVVGVLLGACTHRVQPPAPAPARVVEFARDVRPILEARCQPCHFEGGRMYEKLPFDREETVHRLGTRLFTRIKAEDEQRLISELLAKGN